MDKNPEEPTADEPKDEESLEGTSTVSGASEESGDSTSTDGTTDATRHIPGLDAKSAAPVKPKTKAIKSLASRVNIYLLLFILVLIIAFIIIAAAFLNSKHTSGVTTISSQSLTQSKFEQLANSDATVGNSNQVLTVQSNAIFAGKVLIREGAEIAGALQVGGTTALNELAVSGVAQFGQVQVNKNLSVAGDAGVQGSVTVTKSLQVTGGSTFGGPLSAPQITTPNLQLNGDLVLTHHITAGGATPARANGTALGSGGTASVSGSDTSGNISVNTGSGTSAGCFIAITFNTHFNATPHVIITPIGASAGALNYYVDRTTTGFSVCDSTAPPAGASFGFDYFVID